MNKSNEPTNSHVENRSLNKPSLLNNNIDIMISQNEKNASDTLEDEDVNEF